MRDLAEKIKLAERICKGQPPMATPMQLVMYAIDIVDSQTRLPEAVAKEPICYAIFNAKGEMHWSESCISKQRDDLEDELEILTDSEMPPNSEGWHIAPLYTLLSPLATITKEKP